MGAAATAAPRLRATLAVDDPVPEAAIHRAFRPALGADAHRVTRRFGPPRLLHRAPLLHDDRQGAREAHRLRLFPRAPAEQRGLRRVRAHGPLIAATPDTEHAYTRQVTSWNSSISLGRVYASLAHRRVPRDQRAYQAALLLFTRNAARGISNAVASRLISLCTTAYAPRGSFATPAYNLLGQAAAHAKTSSVARRLQNAQFMLRVA